MRQSRSNRTKISKLFFIHVFCCVCVGSISANFTSWGRLQHVSEFEDSLYKEDILRLAKIAEIESYLDEDINPCNNFYDFVCSNFQKFYPADKGVSTSMLQIMADALKDKVEFLLNSPATANASVVENKVKHFYESCVKVKDQTAETYKSQLLDVIGTFGKMPVLSGNHNWEEENFDWIAMIAKMQREFGKAALLQLDIAQSYRNSSLNCLYVGQPKMLMASKSMYVENSAASHRRQLTATIATTLHEFLDVPMPLAEQTAVEILTLESWLSHGMWDAKVEIEKMNVPTSVLYMQQKYAPTIDVERFVNLTVGPWDGACIFETVESFQVNLRDLLPKVPKYIVANYLYFMLLYDDFFMPAAMTEAAQRTLCQGRAAVYFSKVLDNLVFRHYNIKALERDVRMVFGQLKEVLWRRLETNEFDWMKPKARYNAMEKLKATRLQLNTYEDHNLTTEFSELAIDAADFVGNIRNLLAFRGRQSLARINQPPRPVDADALVSSTPAYMMQGNLIKIPVAILQPYFLWAEGYPKSIKFGNLGTTLAHELIHGFDDEGRKFDKLGNQQNWWELDSMLAFNERKKCLVEQYNKFTAGPHSSRADAVLAENIADNGGVRLAYEAYMRWYSSIYRIPTELARETLAPLKYTHKQLFFISFAQFWCTGTNEDLMQLQLATDTHSPNMYRVIGSLANLPEFGKAFNCPLGSRMNPEEKCSIF